MAFQKYIKNVQRTTVFLIKLVLFLCLFAVFFGLFYIENPQIIALSRTAAITMTTFVIVGLSMTAVYGGFAIGKRKSKDIISSLGIATFITDFITYFQLCIMNTNRFNETVFSFQNIGFFILVVIIHMILITLFTYFGNYVYFKINPPEKCVLICGDKEKYHEVLPKIRKYRKQYDVVEVIAYDDVNLKACIRHNDSVIIYNVPAQQKSEIIEYAYKHYKSIYLNTELSDVVLHYAKSSMMDDMSILVSNIKELSLEQRVIKRIIDIVISGIALIIFSPFMLIEAILIKCYDRGPVFYKQERLTIDEKPFHVLKFRTMIVDAEKASGAVLSSKNDSRITPIGKFLRATRMDELPQFINVIKGDMSMVGPRPERQEIAEQYYKEFPEFKYRLRAKAGLTGLAQIAGKYNTTPKDKLILDLMYIEKYSVWADILIMFQTLKVFFKSDSTEGVDDNHPVEFVKHEEEKDNLK